MAGALSLAGVLAWAGIAAWSATTAPPSPERAQPAPDEPPDERAKPIPTTLYAQASSAYHARLFADEAGAVLLTPMGFTALRQGAPPEPHAASLGSAAVRRGSAIAFWREGKLFEVPLWGGEERELVALPRAPQYLLASEAHLAWVHTDPKQGSRVQTLKGGEVRVVGETPARASAAILRREAVYWVLQSPGGTWRLGRIDLAGSSPTVTPPHRSRPPAMLAAGPDGIYFYDGPKRGVRKASFDLEREETVLANAICSPLAVSSRLLCAQVGNLFEASLSGGAPRLLSLERAGPITEVAATHDRAYWVAESGEDRLLVRSIELTPF